MKGLKFVYKALTNFDLMKWIKILGVKGFKGIFSRNEHMPKPTHSPCIINLDDLEGPGTHWVACFPEKGKKVLFYFDSFGMPYPEEYKARAKADGVKVFFNNFQIQELESLLCGYYCLFFLNEMDKGNSFEELLSVFSHEDQMKNEKFIMKYFD